MHEQPVGVDGAFEAEEWCGRSDPLAGCFLPARVVLLRAGRDRVEVVLLLARRQLPETQHRPTPRTAQRRTARQHPAGASASKFAVQSDRTTLKVGAR